MEDLTRSQAKAMRRQRDDFAQALEHGPSRRFIRALLQNCGIFVVNVDFGEVAAFKEGRRSVALGLVREMNEIDVHLFPKLMQDGANEVVRATVAAKQEQIDE